MNLLLDAHAFRWWIDGDPIPPPAFDALSDPRNMVWLSAASAWEITIKASLGKRRLPDRAARFVEEQRQRSAFAWLPIEASALDILQDLPFDHRDPFDRLLVAQAIAKSCTLVSADPAMGARPVKTIWS